MNTAQKLAHTTFSNRENSIQHSAYSQELAFYHAVQSGDIQKVTELMTPLDSSDFGRLSENPLRNIRYHLIVSIAMIARFCIEAGMPQEDAYTLSDLYIQRADILTDIKSVAALHREMIFDYTGRMRDLSTNHAYSKPIKQCLDYIYRNLHQPFSIAELSTYVNLNPTYLSDLFHRQVGVTLTSYIRNLRIEAAKNMLRYSTYTPIEIANYLCFSSHSYFIQVFKQEVGMTPKQYQQQYFESNWRE